MRMASLRLILLTFAAPVALATSAIAQDAAPTPPKPAISPGRLPDEVIVPPIAVPRAAIGEPTAPPIPVEWSPSPQNDQGRTAYGLYLAGRSAITSGEAKIGADLLAQVQSLTPEQPSVREQAFTASLLAGDLDVAARIAPKDTGLSPAIVEAGELVSAVQTYARGDARAANAALKTRPVRQPHARAGALVGPWIAAAARDWDRALAPPPTPADPLTTLLGRYNRALLFENRRRYDEADVEFKALTDDARSAPLFRRRYGEYLERRDRRDEALAQYDAAIAANQADSGILRARERVVARGKPIAAPDLKEGAAQALRAAAELASAENLNEFAAVYLRLAQNIRPNEERQLVLGQTLAEARLEAASREILSTIGTRDPALYAAARIQIGQSLLRDDDNQGSLEEFQKAQAALPSDPASAYLTAAQLFTLNREEEALAILNGPVLNTPQQPPDIRLMRGAALEELGRIPEAEVELLAALEGRPDDPTFLNYLGYLWVDSGTRVAEGSAMIARAHAADPEDGNIQDSLGWSQYRQGQYAIAVDTLEEAVAKEPANAEINDHLGDAYWQVGRQREAQFQWARVLTLDPDADRRSEVEKKIADGLTPPEPVGGTAP